MFDVKMLKIFFSGEKTIVLKVFFSNFKLLFRFSLGHSIIERYLKMSKLSYLPGYIDR